MLVGLLIIVPLIAGLLVFGTKGKASRNVALIFSLIEFALSLVAFVQYKHNPASADLVLNCTWVESLGIHFAVGLDALSLLLVSLLLSS